MRARRFDREREPGVRGGALRIHVVASRLGAGQHGRQRLQRGFRILHRRKPRGEHLRIQAISRRERRPGLLQLGGKLRDLVGPREPGACEKGQEVGALQRHRLVAARRAIERRTRAGRIERDHARHRGHLVHRALRFARGIAQAALGEVPVHHRLVVAHARHVGEQEQEVGRLVERDPLGQPPTFAADGARLGDAVQAALQRGQVVGQEHAAIVGVALLAVGERAGQPRLGVHRPAGVRLALGREPGGDGVEPRIVRLRDQPSHLVEARVGGAGREDGAEVEVVVARPFGAIEEGAQRGAVERGALRDQIRVARGQLGRHGRAARERTGDAAGEQVVPGVAIERPGDRRQRGDPLAGAGQAQRMIEVVAREARIRAQDLVGQRRVRRRPRDHALVGVVPRAGALLLGGAQPGRAGARLVAPARFAERSDCVELLGSGQRQPEIAQHDRAVPGRLRMARRRPQHCIELRQRGFTFAFEQRGERAIGVDVRRSRRLL